MDENEIFHESVRLLFDRIVDVFPRALKSYVHGLTFNCLNLAFVISPEGILFISIVATIVTEGALQISNQKRIEHSLPTISSLSPCQDPFLHNFY